MAKQKPSAGFIFYCPDDSTVLLTKRAPEMNSPNTWDIQGGRWDKEDDSSIETANREAHEELGTLPHDRTLIARHEIPRSKEHKSKYIVFVYSIDAKEKKHWTPKIKIDQDESSEYRWFPIDSLPSNTHFDLSWLGSEIN